MTTEGHLLQAHMMKSKHLSSMGKGKNLLLVLKMTESHPLEVPTRTEKQVCRKTERHPSQVARKTENHPSQVYQKTESHLSQVCRKSEKHLSQVSMETPLPKGKHQSLVFKKTEGHLCPVHKRQRKILLTTEDCLLLASMVAESYPSQANKGKEEYPREA